MADAASGAYAPLIDDPAFDLDGQEGEYSRGPFLFLVALIVLAAFGGVIYVAYNQGLRQGGQSAPLIVAEPGPIKVAPQNPGGLQEPFQDKFVLNPGIEIDVVRLMPEPEEPVSRPLAANIESSAVVAPAEEEAADITAEIESAPTATLEVVDLGLPAAAGEVSAIVERVEETVAAEPVVETPPAVETLEPEPVQVVAVPRPPELAPSAGSIDADSGSYVVQLASISGERDRAVQKLQTLEQTHNEIMTGLAFNIRRADLAEKGIYFRVRVGPFEERKDASVWCETLKGRGQDCFVTKP